MYNMLDAKIPADGESPPTPLWCSVPCSSTTPAGPQIKLSGWFNAVHFPSGWLYFFEDLHVCEGYKKL